MKTNYPTISVVIPVKNEGAKIRACIEGILAQTVPVTEIIVVDSGSTDGTIEILQEYDKVKLLQIPSSEFNHGETRNYGVRHAVGEYALLTVGDARPYDQHWISHLLAGFSSPDVAGVCGQQVCPHETDKNPVDWFRPYSAPSTKSFSFGKEEFKKLDPAKKLEACGWDDVTAMYKREILLQIPFRRTSFSEDAIWARDALQAGHTIVYNNAARVYHYHNENKDFTFKRTLTTIYMRYKELGYVYPKGKRNWRRELSMLKLIWIAKPMSLKEKWGWVKYNRDQQQAIRKAHTVFREALAQGEQVLDQTHEKYCGKPPVPLKTPVLV